jgi:AraC-like ligand binding domain
MNGVETFDKYKADHLAQGFDEVLERAYGPDVVVDSHTHSFSVKALVVQGEMWLTEGTETRHLRPGDRFELDPLVPHSERYGSDGAVYWAARRNWSLNR